MNRKEVFTCDRCGKESEEKMAGIHVQLMWGLQCLVKAGSPFHHHYCKECVELLERQLREIIPKWKDGE